MYDRCDVDRFLLKRDLPMIDSRHVRQVVNKTRKVVELPIDDGSRPFELRVGRPETPERFDSIPDRRQRAPEFMGKHGEKFVLVAVGLVPEPAQLQVRPDAGNEFAGSEW